MVFKHTEYRGRKGQPGVSAHTDLLGLRHGGQLMELSGSSWKIVTGVVGASLRTLSQKKQSCRLASKLESCGVRRVDFRMGAWRGLSVPMDQSSTGPGGHFCMPVQSYDGQGAAPGLRGRYCVFCRARRLGGRGAGVGFCSSSDAHQQARGTD